MESEEQDGREVWLKAVERFSKVLEEQLERDRKRPDVDEDEIVDLLQIHLKLLTLWERQIPNRKEGSKAESKTRWIKRESGQTPQEPSVD